MSDRLQRLRDLRDQLTGWLGSDPAPVDRAQLALRLEKVLEQIEACEKAAPSKKETPLDELRTRRAARSATGKTDAKSAKSGRRG